MQNNIQTEIVVKNRKIGVIYINGQEYISLTDLAKYVDEDEPRFPILNWIRNKDVILFLGLWEMINNDNFNRVEFDTVKSDAGTNSFRISPLRWINMTNAVGIVSKSGRYLSGTFAHSDIAFEFASWLSPEFKLYLITEFQKLKKLDYYKNQKIWEANRLLTKANYLVHTNAFKNYIVPNLTSKQIKKIYADEADVLNVALFGMTAKEWRVKNPNLAKDGNIRDYADILELIILNNLENLNASMIKDNMSQSKRLVKLNEIARNQISLFQNNKSIIKLENNH